VPTDPLVGVLLGSANDVDQMQPCLDKLKSLGIAHEMRVLSAHRTPDDAAAQLERLEKQTAGYGAFLLMAHDWADPHATLRSYELLAQEVFPGVQRSADRAVASREWCREDHDKLIGSAIAAVTSPKITDNELISIAKSRNVGDEVIRIITRNKEITRNYQVRHALATNPRTPQAEAMKFVNYLQERDLRSIMKSKDVPSAISTHARRILTRKGKL